MRRKLFVQKVCNTFFFLLNVLQNTCMNTFCHNLIFFNESTFSGSCVLFSRTLCFVIILFVYVQYMEPMCVLCMSLNVKKLFMYLWTFFEFILKGKLNEVLILCWLLIFICNRTRWMTLVYDRYSFISKSNKSYRP